MATTINAESMWSWPPNRSIYRLEVLEAEGAPPSAGRFLSDEATGCKVELLPSAAQYLVVLLSGPRPRELAVCAGSRALASTTVPTTGSRSRFGCGVLSASWPPPAAACSLDDPVGVSVLAERARENDQASLDRLQCWCYRRADEALRSWPDAACASGRFAEAAWDRTRRRSLQQYDPVIGPWGPFFDYVLRSVASRRPAPPGRLSGDVRDHRPSPADEAAEAELCEYLSQAIPRALTGQEQAVLREWLRGRSNGEIAQGLHLHRSDVSRLIRYRQHDGQLCGVIIDKLRGRVGPEGGEE
jgi:hypothetical protein